MQKWEYLVLKINRDHAWSSPRGIVVNDQPEERIGKGKYPERASSLSKCLAHFGAQGWELVTADVGVEFIFKRPKQE